MEYQNQIQPRNTNLFLVILFWIYSIIHLIAIIVLFFIKLDNYNSFDLFIFISIIIISLLFIITTIIVNINYYTNCCSIYICLIPSILNELTLTGYLLFFLFLLNFFRNIRPEELIILITSFLAESFPNIILFIHICKKSKNKNTRNIHNNNKAQLLDNI